MPEKLQKKKGKIIVKTDGNINIDNDELLPEYEIDYSKAVRNPYYGKNRTFIEIDEEVALAFKTPDNINRILKAIAKSLPPNAAAVL